MRLVGRNGKCLGSSFPDDITDAITYNLESQIGSSVARLDTNGTVIDKEEYYPFGDSSLRTFTKKRYRYVGKEKDLESGLYYYGARYYAAWTCRFISVDKLAANYMQLTPYQNAGNNPINDYDIDGNQGPGTPDTVDIVYPDGKSIKVNKNEYGHYEVTQAQLDAIGPFGTNWHDDRSTDSSTIKLEAGGELDVVCEKCNHGIDSYVTIKIPKQVAVTYNKDNASKTFTAPKQPKTNPSQKEATYFDRDFILNNIFYKSSSYVINDAITSARGFYADFIKNGFGANSTNPNSLVDSITVYYWKSSDPNEASKVDTYMKVFIEQLKKEFGSSVKINVQNMSPKEGNAGNSVSPSVKKKG